MFYLFDLIVPITLILNRELVAMKKIIIVTFFVLCIVVSAWGEASFKEIKILAKQGDAKVQYLLGGMYCLGNGTPQDYKKAIYWLTKSAEQGDVSAQYLLGGMYSLGNGTPQDYKKAIYWYTKSAEQGNAEAQCLVGLLYYLGDGIPQDYKTAYIWFNLASANGNKDAREVRDEVLKKLSAKQIVEAQQISIKIQKRINFK